MDERILDITVHHKVSLRLASKEDVESLIRAGYWGNGADPSDQLAIRATRRFYDGSGIGFGEAVIAWIEETPIGYIWVDRNTRASERTGIIQMLWVAQKFQRRGIGRALIEQAECYVKEVGLATAEIGATEPVILSRYQSYGYTIQKQNFVEEFDQQEGNVKLYRYDTAWVLTKELGTNPENCVYPTSVNLG